MIFFDLFDIGAWFYKRGKLYNLLDTKFINSGCIVGRVKEMKIMLNNTIENMKLTHHDDQLALMEYYFHHPHIISIDRSNQIFLCAYKILSNDISLNYTTGKIMIRQQSTSIGLVHFNSGMVRDLSDK